MLRLQKILFPVDFSDRCIHTAAYVAGLSQKFNGCLTLLYAFNGCDRSNYQVTSVTEPNGSPIAMLWEQHEAAMAEFGKAALAGLNVKRVIEDGEPGDVICRYVRHHSIDLVVMPTHGYGGFRRLLLGSTTTKVLHDAHCPIWTTAHCQGLDERCAQCIAHMVCGVSLGPDSVDVVRRACELAKYYRAELHLVHAVGSDMLQVKNAPFQRFLMDAAIEKAASLQAGMNTQLDICIEHGDVAHVIREAAMNCSAGLAIVGRGHASKRLGSLRTNVNAIVRHSPCPVLSL